MARILAAVLAVLALFPAAVGAEGTRLLREPTISATQVAFAYANDLWVVGRDGGAARRLTSFPGTETHPCFSPDGSSIAFTAAYGGNDDVYVVPAAGGEPVRLTWHPGDDEVCGWSRDGTRILFTSARDAAPGGHPRLWTVPAGGGLETPLPLERAVSACYSPDGRRIALQSVERWQPAWRNYRGGQAQPIWLVDLAGGDLVKVPGPVSVNDCPVWLGNAVYFVSDRDYARNVHAYDLGSGEVRQLTRFRDQDVQHLSGGGGALVFEQAGALHVLDPATGSDRTLEITAAGDFPWAMPHWVEAEKSLARGGLSPTGQRAVFEARGEIVTIPVEKGDPRVLTRSPGAADRAPAWSPDGRHVAWFSDASGEYRLVIGSQDGLEAPREIAIPDPTYFYDPAWSPDGKRIAFTDAGRNLLVAEVASGKVTRVDGDTYAHPERTLVPVWSPDSRFLAYAKRLPTQFLAVMIWSAADGKVRRVTDGMSDARWPAWDAGGKYLWFLASTDVGLASGWLSMSSHPFRPRYALYAAVLAKGTPSPFLPESDEEPAKDAAARDSTPAKGASARAAAKDTSVTVRVDFEGLDRRIVSAGVPLRPYAGLRAGAAGVLFLAEEIEDPPTQTLHRYDLAKRTLKPFLEAVDSYALSKDGRKLLYRSKDAWYAVGTEAEPKAGDGKLKTAVSVWVDPRAEWRQIFGEAWRFQRDYLYVRNLHGADWPAVRRAYEPLLAHVAHRSDLTHLLALVGGELSIGHSYVFGGDLPEVKREPIGLLGADVVEDHGRYRIARVYDGETWNPALKAPLAAPGVRAAVGDYVLAVNGVEVRAPANFHRFFEGTQDRQTALRLSRAPDGKDAWTTTVVPVGARPELDLRVAAWVEHNRRTVDSLSHGRLAYVWLPNTALEGYANFNRYYFAQQDRDGVIVDERYNEGGWVADYFIEVMRRSLFGFFNNPVGDRRPWTSPEAGIWGPKVLIANERSGSGGDMLPYMFQQQKLGTVVGTRTWGGLVGIWDVPRFVDGGGMTAPRGGFFNRDGQWDVENQGVTPDVEVEQAPREVMAGHDPQLERAVQVAMERLADWQSPLRPEPPAPVRVRRPQPI